MHAKPIPTLSDPLSEPGVSSSPSSSPSPLAANPFPGIRLHTEQQPAHRRTASVDAPATITPPRRLRRRDTKHDPFLSLFDDQGASQRDSLFDSARKKPQGPRPGKGPHTGSLSRPLSGFKASLFEEDDADDSFLSTVEDSLSAADSPAPSHNAWLFSDPFKLFPDDPSAAAAPSPLQDALPPQDPAELNKLLETIPGLSKALSAYHVFAGKVSVKQLAFETLHPPFSEDRLATSADLSLLLLPEESPAARPQLSNPRAITSPRRSDANPASPPSEPLPLLQKSTSSFS